MAAVETALKVGTMPDSSWTRSELATMDTLVRRAGAPAFAVDDDRRIVAWNEEARRLTGLGAAEVLGRPCHEVIQGMDTHGNPFCRPVCNLVWTCRQGRPVFPFPLSIRSAEGGRGEAVLSLVAVPARRGPILIHLLRFDGEPAPAPKGGQLTAREKEILKLLAGGKVAKEVASSLCLSVATVRAHVRNSLRKLGAHSQAQAIALALKDGLL